MILPSFFDTKKSLNLFGISEYFKFLKNLYLKGKLPNVLMLSGKKGSGKSTLLNHFIFSIFDKENYDDKNYILNDHSFFYNQFINDIYPNIIYLSGTDIINSKIESIRDLKKKLFKTSISSKPRFIILDDVELFNTNSLNALLKTIEEPKKNNFFFLINNKSKPLIETIQSRCLDIKLILKEEKRLEIIDLLVEKYDLNLIIDPKISKLTPGCFIKFNYIFEENKIFLNEDFITSLNILLNLYKKNKAIMYIDMILFLTDNHFNNINKKNFSINEKIIENRRFVFDNINKFFLYNLNQNLLLNIIRDKVNDG